MSHNDLLVVGTRRARVREDPPTSVLLIGGGCEEGGTGLGRANQQQVITTRWWRLGRARTGVGESEPPTSVVNSLVAVGAGEDRGWAEKPPTRCCGWWLKRGKGGLPVSVSETIREKLMYIP